MRGRAPSTSQNHGGRIVDGCVDTAAALSDVVDAVGGDTEVYVDGGIRSGVDVMRALALGAHAVFVGRPVLWGLAVDGEAGVRDVLKTFASELRRALAFCGVANLEKVTRDLLAV
jgi:4-hydroxymandelate oxidase